MQPGCVRRRVRVSDRAELVRAAAALDAVLEYPHGCTEQRVAKARAVMAAGELRELLSLDQHAIEHKAADGAGLGHDFLRHVERTGVLVHLLEVAPLDGTDAAGNYRAIRNELASHSETLAAKPEILVLNKIDLVPEAEREAVVAGIAADLGLDEGELPLVVSGATGEGVGELLEVCWRVTGASDKERAWG